MKGVPDTRVARILRENGMDPDPYGVTYQDETVIRLYCYKTRDDITIKKGDRAWKNEQEDQIKMTL